MVEELPCYCRHSAYRLDDARGGGLAATAAAAEERWALRAGGCRAVVQRGELPAHEDGCAHRPVGCSAADLDGGIGCGWRGSLDKLPAHAAR